MSHVRMDHAGWVERNNEAAKKLSWRRASKRDKHGRIIGYAAAPERLSPFQGCVMNILGIAGNGIDNAPISWGAIDWRCDGGISVLWDGGLATFDDDRLTRLVMLCHDARIRCFIEPASAQMLRLSFWPRSHEGGTMGRHPNLEEAVAQHRAAIPLDHSIVYQPEPVNAEAVPA